MALVASLRLLETIWTLDLFICQMRTHLHANWCLIAAPGTKAWSYFNCHDLNLWPGDNMLKAYLIKISFFSSHSLRELYIVLIFFFFNQIAWWKVTEKSMSLWNDAMHLFLSFDGFDFLPAMPRHLPKNDLLCMITLRQSR